MGRVGMTTLMYVANTMMCRLRVIKMGKNGKEITPQEAYRLDRGQKKVRTGKKVPRPTQSPDERCRRNFHDNIGTEAPSFRACVIDD
jgi:hypothetical protein